MSSDEVTMTQGGVEGVPDDVPDLLNVGAIPSNYAASIDTDILEPVVHTDSFVRYQLVNKGFLNPFSRICFSLDFPAGATIKSIYPIGVGVNSLISRATLKIGNKTICETDDFNHWQAYKSLFISNEAQKEREQFLSGRVVSHQKKVIISSGAAPAAGTDASFSRNQTTAIILDNGLESNQGLKAAAFTATSSMRPELSIVNKPVFSVTLEELFPLFRGAQFPLYVLNSDMPVQIELTMSAPTFERVCANGTDGGDVGVSYTLNRNDSRMIADYTTYDGDVMAAWAKKNSQLMFSYMDYRLSRTTVTADENGDGEAVGQIRNVGGAGRLVSKVFVGLNNNKNAEQTLLNKYHAEAPFYVNNVYEKLTANVKKNDQFIYPIDRSNTALHFQAIVDAEKLPPFVVRDEYSGQGSALTGDLFEGQEINEELQGKFFWNCYKFPDGERVNSRGVELHTSAKYPGAASPDEEVYIQRAYLEILKTFVMDGGRADCYYS